MLEVFEGNNFGCKVCISLKLGLYIIFDSAPESVKKSTSRSGDYKSLLFGLSRISGIVQIFSLVRFTLFAVSLYIFCLYLNFL